MNLHIFAQECANLKFFKYCRNTSPPVKVACHPTNSSLLDFLNLAGLVFMVGVPYGCSIFQLRLDQGIVGSLSYTWHVSFYIPLHKFECFICDACDPVYILFLWSYYREVPRIVKSHVLMSWNVSWRYHFLCYKSWRFTAKPSFTKHCSQN